MNIMMYIIGATVASAFLSADSYTMDLSRRDLINPQKHPKIDARLEDGKLNHLFDLGVKDFEVADDGIKLGSDYNDIKKHELLLEELDENRAMKPFAPLSHEELIDFENFDEVGPKDISEHKDMRMMDEEIDQLEIPQGNLGFEAHSWSDEEDLGDSQEGVGGEAEEVFISGSIPKEEHSDDKIQELVRQIVKEEFFKIAEREKTHRNNGATRKLRAVAASSGRRVETADKPVIEVSNDIKIGELRRSEAFELKDFHGVCGKARNMLNGSHDCRILSTEEECTEDESCIWIEAVVNDFGELQMNIPAGIGNIEF